MEAFVGVDWDGSLVTEEEALCPLSGQTWQVFDELHPHCYY
jgi:hypothetical protein